MIDQDKMRALAKRIRNTQADCTDSTEAADAIDLLLAEVEAAKEQSRKWQALTESSQQVAEMAQRRADKLRAELEAAAADKRDAERYRWMAERFLGVDFEWGRGEDGYGGIPVLVIKIPENEKVWGCLDLTVDYHLGRAPASEGEQK